MYGHLDKQPEFTGWRNDLGPWTPKYEDGLLYGRGGADDGYAVYASVAALQALKAQGVAHPRIVGLIETCEETRLLRPAAVRRCAAPAPGRRGAGDLPGFGRRQLRPAVAHHLAARHGQRHAQGRGADRRHPLRRRLGPGAVELPHHAAGARPARGQQDRPPAARELPLRSAGRPPGAGARPRPRSSATRSTSAFRGRTTTAAARPAFALPTTTDPVEALLNRTWKPTLSVTGAEGFPALKDAGNVLRPYTAFKLSLRLPPLVDADAGGAGTQGAARRQRALPGQGDLRERRRRHRLERARPSRRGSSSALNAASQAHFGAPCGYIGQGGTIPLMNMLSEGFPKAQMMVCGVLGPEEQRARPERVPARALREEADGRGGRGDRRACRRRTRRAPLRRLSDACARPTARRSRCTTGRSTARRRAAVVRAGARPGRARRPLRPRWPRGSTPGASRCARYDHHGHGESERRARRPAEPASRLVDDLAPVVDEHAHAPAPACRWSCSATAWAAWSPASFVARDVRPVDGAGAVVAGARPGLERLAEAAAGRRCRASRRTCAWATASNSTSSRTTRRWSQAYRADPLCHDRICGRLARFLADEGAAVQARGAGTGRCRRCCSTPATTGS